MKTRKYILLIIIILNVGHYFSQTKEDTIQEEINQNYVTSCKVHKKILSEYQENNDLIKKFNLLLIAQNHCVILFKKGEFETVSNLILFVRDNFTTFFGPGNNDILLNTKTIDLEKIQQEFDISYKKGELVELKSPLSNMSNLSTYKQ